MTFRRVSCLLCAFSALLLSLSPVQASLEFKKNNPDIGKYAFAQSYIASLSYLNVMYLRWQQTSPKKVYAGDDVKVMHGYVAYLIKDNLDLRIAKNYLNKYLQAKNPLIRKTAETYISACLTLILINDKEKEVWDQWYAIKSNKLDTKANEKAFIRKQEEFALKRKEAYKAVIESSIFLTKVLKSERNDSDKGHVLAITAKERNSLLKHLDEYGKGVLDWGLKSGQDYMQASIAVIREVLEDTINTCLDE